MTELLKTLIIVLTNIADSSVSENSGKARIDYNSHTYCTGIINAMGKHATV